MLGELIAASGLIATTYGYGEMMCGDIGQARKCEHGAIMASGIPFSPELPIIALALPTNRKLRPTVIWVRLEGSEEICVPLMVADKKNPRFINTKPFDLTPAALRELGVDQRKINKHWSGVLHVCQVLKHDGRIIKIGSPK